MKLILASGSPRRRELLGLLNIPFAVKTADIDETMNPELPAEHEVARVSAAKAQAVAAQCPDSVIISADTIVVYDNVILGKPHSEAQAAQMLRMLSGRTHEVMTGLSVYADGKADTRVVKTEVTFRDLSEAEIRDYIATGEPMDKAGAYGIQGRACVFVSHLSGDYFTVMGLPMCTLYEMLRAHGVFGA